MRYPGEVWYLPPEAREEGDPKARRHVLLTPCAEEGDLGVFAYASTAAVEAAFGGASFLLDPYARSYPHTGFDRPTYITLCRLVTAPSEDMKRMTGRIVDEMPDIRRELRKALGLGTGTSASGPAAGSFRGRVAELSRALAAEMDTRFAVIVSEPGYSLAERYQLIVPLLNAAEYNAEPGDVLVSRTSWLPQLQRGLTEALIAPKLIQAAFHPSDIARVLRQPIDDATIGELDRALIALFGL